MPNSQHRILTTILAGALAMSLLGVAGCSTGDEASKETDNVSKDTPKESSEQTVTIPGEEPLYTASYKPNGSEVAVLETSKGTIRIEFYSDVAPNHVGAFIELSQAGFYNGVKFHRVVPGFVVQGGDPQTKGFTGTEVAEIVQRQSVGQYEPGEPALGTGGPEYRLAQEFNERQHLEGTLAMARSTDPDSGGSQFYICLAPQPKLDGDYTVFGQVIDGMDVVKKLAVGDEIVSLKIENSTP